MRDAPFYSEQLTRLALAVGATLAACAAFAADPPPSHENKAPNYGDALFHIFQDHYFT